MSITFYLYALFMQNYEENFETIFLSLAKHE